MLWVAFGMCLLNGNMPKLKKCQNGKSAENCQMDGKCGGMNMTQWKNGIHEKSAKVEKMPKFEKTGKWMEYFFSFLPSSEKLENGWEMVEIEQK
jgi:hypothetical protein